MRAGDRTVVWLRPRRTKEMMRPCPLYLRVISLVGQVWLRRDAGRPAGPAGGGEGPDPGGRPADRVRLVLPLPLCANFVVAKTPPLPCGPSGTITRPTSTTRPRMTLPFAAFSLTFVDLPQPALPFLRLPLPFHCLSLTFHCLCTAFRYETNVLYKYSYRLDLIAGPHGMVTTSLPLPLTHCLPPHTHTHTFACVFLPAEQQA